jgi:hypothetical protein
MRASAAAVSRERARTLRLRKLARRLRRHRSGVGVTTRFVAVGVRAVDPLANKYNRLLEDAGLAPTIRTEAVDGEKLVERFGRDRFDIAYSRNALDHTADPWL